MEVGELMTGNYLLTSLKSGQGRKVEREIGVEDIVRIANGTGGFVYEPIEITEDWLIKLGFDKKTSVIYMKDEFMIFCSEGNEKVDIYFCDKLVGIYEYVHRLQNLYYWLNDGKKLTIKK